MEVLSMTGFRRMCESIYPTSFIFDTENQPNGASARTKIVAKYSEVIFMLNPNRICFKSDMGTLCINGVKSIMYHNDDKNIGRIFSIISGNLNNDEADNLCVIVANCTKTMQSKKIG